MKTVHCIREECTHYCGRPQSYEKAKGGPIDLSLLGNPFLVKQYGLGNCIALYRQYLWKEIQANNNQIIQTLLDLPDDAVLGCFCAPKDCHCDIIIRASNWLKQNKGYAASK